MPQTNHGGVCHVCIEEPVPIILHQDPMQKTIQDGLLLIAQIGKEIILDEFSIIRSLPKRFLDSN